MRILSRADHNMVNNLYWEILSLPQLQDFYRREIIIINFINILKNFITTNRVQSPQIDLKLISVLPKVKLNLLYKELYKFKSSLES